MNLYRYIIVFITCWIATSIAFYLLEIIFPSQKTFEVIEFISQGFIAAIFSVIIAFILYKRTQTPTSNSQSKSN